MDLKKYKLLKVPFASKKKISEILDTNLRSKYMFSGIAYYIVDLNSECIVWERAVLNEAEYRPTDNAMLITSHYESYFTKKNLDRREIFGWSENDKEVLEADGIILSKINEYSLKHTNTVLSIESLITGSNATGADKTISAAPILIDPRLESEYVRFVNAIKRIRCHDKIFSKSLKAVLDNVEDIERIFPNKITLEELSNLIPKFGKWLKIINSDIVDFDSGDDEVVEYINEINQKEIQNSVLHAIAMQKHELISEEKLIQKLRREFRMSLLKEAIENGYSEYAGDSQISIYDTEAAHILGVSEIKSNNLDIEWIANPNNGLLLSPTVHKALDKNKMYLSEDGTIKYISNEYDEGRVFSLLPETLNDERINFIKLRNKYQSN